MMNGVLDKYGPGADKIAYGMYRPSTDS